MKQRLLSVLRGDTVQGLSLGLGFALASSLAGCQSPAPAQATTTPSPAETHMSWKTQCVGRVQMKFPDQGKPDWSQAFHGAHVKRLWQPMSLEQFWSGVETVKRGYEAKKHDEYSSRLAHFERVDNHTGLVIGYDNGEVLTGPVVRAFTWLDPQHAYEIPKGIALTEEVKPTPALFAPDIARYTKALQNIVPIAEGQMPSGPGFCIDGAMVTDDTDLGTSVFHAVEYVPGIRLVAAYQENISRAEIYSGFGELKIEQRLANGAAQAGQGYKEFTVLRRQERTLDGLLGQEFVLRRVNKDGVMSYRFWWGVRGANEGGIQRPAITVHMATQKSGKDNFGKVLPPLPPEEKLIDLWDYALSTFKRRAGAMPPGQAIEAFNADDGLTPWHEPK